MNKPFCATLIAVISLLGCGLFEPNVEPCEGDCPDIGGRDSGPASGTGGSDQGGSGPHDGGRSGKGGTEHDGGVGGKGGSGAGTSGSAGAPPAGSGAAGDAGGDAGQGGDGGSTPECGSCPSNTPVCVDSQCVECEHDTDCDEGVCEDQECVQCRESTECADATASRCTGAGECIGCLVTGDCSHIEGKPECAGSECVECTGERFDACGRNGTFDRLVCDSLAQTCTDYPEHSAGLCEPCVSDAQCSEGQLCVMQTFNDPDDDPDQGEIDVGYFCFWREDSDEASAPNGDCVNVRPYVDTRTNADSIDGTRATVCGLEVTTCAGYKDFRTKECTDPSDDAACGDDRFETDAFCEQFSASTYRCTTPCLSDDDCRTGATCNTSGTQPFCNLQ